MRLPGVRVAVPWSLAVTVAILLSRLTTSLSYFLSVTLKTIYYLGRAEGRLCQAWLTRHVRMLGGTVLGFACLRCGMAAVQMSGF